MNDIQFNALMHGFAEKMASSFLTHALIGSAIGGGIGAAMPNRENGGRLKRTLLGAATGAVAGGGLKFYNKGVMRKQKNVLNAKRKTIKDITGSLNKSEQYKHKFGTNARKIRREIDQLRFKNKNMTSQLHDLTEEAEKMLNNAQSNYVPHKPRLRIVKKKMLNNAQSNYVPHKPRLRIVKKGKAKKDLEKLSYTQNIGVYNNLDQKIKQIISIYTDNPIKNIKDNITMRSLGADDLAISEIIGETEGAFTVILPNSVSLENLTVGQFINATRKAIEKQKITRQTTLYQHNVTKDELDKYHETLDTAGTKGIQVGGLAGLGASFPVNRYLLRPKRVGLVGRGLTSSILGLIGAGVGNAITRRAKADPRFKPTEQYDKVNRADLPFNIPATKYQKTPHGLKAISYFNPW